jgi:lysophospholipase L1-like esterase
MGKRIFFLSLLVFLCIVNISAATGLFEWRVCPEGYCLDINKDGIDDYRFGLDGKLYSRQAYIGDGYVVISGGLSYNKSPSIALFGDSITNLNQGSDENQDNDRGYFYWANYLLKQRFFVYELGTDGDETADMLARINEVYAVSPRFCLVMGGANDFINGGVTAAQMYNNLIAIAQGLKSHGIECILCTIPPIDNIDSAPEAQIWSTVNRRLKEYALTNSVRLVDTARAYIDTAATYPNPITGATIDGIHPSMYGSYLLGQVIQSAISDLVPETPQLPCHNNDPDNILVNGLMLGTGGTGTGDIAASWQIGGAATSTNTKTARTDGLPGAWQTMAITATGVQSTWLFQSVADQSGNIGRSLYGLIEVNMATDWTTELAGMDVYVEFQDSESAVIQTVKGLGHTETTQNVGYGSGIIRIPKTVIPALTDKIALWIYTRATDGGGTQNIGRCALYLTDD